MRAVKCCWYDEREVNVWFIDTVAVIYICKYVIIIITIWTHLTDCDEHEHEHEVDQEKIECISTVL